MSKQALRVGFVGLAVVLAVGCTESGQAGESISSTDAASVSSSTASTAAEAEVATTTQPTAAPVETTEATSTALVTTTAGTMSSSEFEDDVELILDLYGGWSEAVGVGRAEIEAYLAAHLYPELPSCASGEKALPAYTAQRESIRRADEWEISWGPLDGVRPDGRVYEVQLEELDSPSHVAVHHGVAYVFWNCRGDTEPAPSTTSGGWYAVSEPSYAPASMPGSNGAAGSGCSPGIAKLPDGIWFGFIDAAAEDRLSFDLACVWPDRNLDEGFITNDSNKLRDISVAPAATAYQVVDRGGIGWVPMAYSDWLFAPPDESLCSWPCDAAWIYVNDGVVTELVQLFFP